ncbi:MAG TPA: 6-bladed beta-propeller [Balneolaceae bacterium]|nr:6-bladed beta-propeller [Balneolaceae bacterium]
MQRWPLFLTTLLFFACGEEHNTGYESPDQSDDFQFELKKTSGFVIDSEELFLDRVRDVAVFNHDESLIGWINDDRNEIFVTDTQGNYIAKFGSSGSGPSEFQYITAIGFDSNNNIFTYDPRLGLFKIFTLDGEFSRSMPGLISDDLWSRTGKIYIRGESMYLGIQETGKASDENYWQSKIIAEYNLNGELLKKFGAFDLAYIESDQDRLYKYPNIYMDHHMGSIYTTHRIHPYINVFDSDTGKHKGRFGIKSINFSEPSEPARISDPMHIRRKKNLEQSGIGESFTSNDYFFLNFFNMSEEFYTLQDPNLKEHFFNIFQKEPPYAFLGEITLDYAPLGVTSDNKVFLLEDDNPDNFKVGIYELVEN